MDLRTVISDAQARVIEEYEVEIGLLAQQSLAATVYEAVRRSIIEFIGSPTEQSPEPHSRDGGVVYPVGTKELP